MLKTVCSVSEVEFIQEAVVDPPFHPWPWDARGPGSLLGLKPDPVGIHAKRSQDFARTTLASSCENDEHVCSPRLAQPKSMGGPESILRGRRKR